MKKHLGFFIVYPIVMILIIALGLFYLDLANGPIIFLILFLVEAAAFIITSIILLNAKMRYKVLSWVGFFAILFAILLPAHPYEAKKNASYMDNPEKTSVLTIRDGKIQGVYAKGKDVEVYAGIPYAKAPIGELRWKEPQEPEPWEGVRDCQYFAPKAMQAKSNPIMSSLVDIYAAKSYHMDFSYQAIEFMSEDCLYLNVWKPSGDVSNLPVVVYIHGGSLTSGTSSYEAYNGETFARNGVIYIDFAYRLGVFGYFALDELANESPNGTTGNYGLLDQIQVLKWVQANAAYFGGDANNVTIAGESAGSSSVSAICASPLAHGLFRRAIGESSSVVVSTPPHTFRTLAAAKKMGEQIKAEFQCTSLADLRKLPAEQLINTQYANSSMTVDGYALPKTPYEIYSEGNNNEEALLNGCNSLEADAFVVPRFLFNPTGISTIKERVAGELDEEAAEKLVALYDFKNDNDAFLALNEIISGWWFVYPHYSWNKMLEANGLPTYRYYFDKENRWYSGYHSGELRYAYGNVKNDPKTYRFDESDYRLEDIMVGYWTNFAKTGNPNGEGLPKWDAWNSASNKLQRLGETVEPIRDKFEDMYPIFEEYLARSAAHE